MKTLSINIPFGGFYESKWSDLVDDAAEQHARDYAGDGQKEADIPEALRLSESEVSECVFSACNYYAGYAAIARDYPEAFNAQALNVLGFDLNLTFEELTSPREYNFETDRIFCRIPVSIVRRLFALSRKDRHSRLSATIASRFTSRSGFISFYDNTLQSWLEKPLLDWDANELGTLLIACLDGELDDMEIYYSMSDNSHQYFENAMDWPKFEERVQDVRDEKAQDWNDANPDQEIPAPPYRCPVTPDLFLNL